MDPASPPPSPRSDAAKDPIAALAAQRETLVRVAEDLAVLRDAGGIDVDGDALDLDRALTRMGEAAAALSRVERGVARARRAAARAIAIEAARAESLASSERLAAARAALAASAGAVVVPVESLAARTAGPSTGPAPPPVPVVAADPDPEDGIGRTAPWPSADDVVDPPGDVPAQTGGPVEDDRPARPRFAPRPAAAEISPPPQSPPSGDDAAGDGAQHPLDMDDERVDELLLSLGGDGSPPSRRARRRRRPDPESTSDPDETPAPGPALGDADAVGSDPSLRGAVVALLGIGAVILAAALLAVGLLAGVAAALGVATSFAVGAVIALSVTAARRDDVLDQPAPSLTSPVTPAGGPAS